MIGMNDGPRSCKGMPLIELRVGLYIAGYPLTWVSGVAVGSDIGIVFEVRQL